MNREERKFISDMFKASQGVGEDPTDEALKEQCGMTDKRIKWTRDIAKRFLIK